MHFPVAFLLWPHCFLPIETINCECAFAKLPPKGVAEKKVISYRVHCLWPLEAICGVQKGKREKKKPQHARQVFISFGFFSPPSSLLLDGAYCRAAFTVYTHSH